MMRWIVQLTVRDAQGKVNHEFLGSHALSELPGALELAMQRADEVGAGLQVVREPTMPGLLLRSP
jgi:hypothetical protein